LSAAWQGELAAGLLDRLAGLPPPQFIGLDGWSGSGKTSLAAVLAPAIGAAVLALDDLVPGWDGLEASVEHLATDVLPALAAGRSAPARTWRWETGRPGPPRTVPPRSRLLVEGCGAGAAAVRPWLSALVWLDVDVAVRRDRLRRRADWDAYRPWLERWAAQEAALRAGDDPAPEADAVVEERPGAPVVVHWRNG
jgi:para-aminobenzoate synthetase